ncbi:hypothetical protein [Streptomyces antibioticus]
MQTWRDYWHGFGVPYGIFQVFMVLLWVVSGVGMFGGLAWMAFR